MRRGKQMKQDIGAVAHRLAEDHRLSDYDFWRALKNNFVFFAIHMLVQNPLGIALAAMLSIPRLRLAGFYRTAIFLPNVKTSQLPAVYKGKKYAVGTEPENFWAPKVSPVPGAPPPLPARPTSGRRGPAPAARGSRPRAGRPAGDSPPA